MGKPDIYQMKQALIRQGVQEFKLNGLSEEQLRKMCDEKLSFSLTGNQNWGNTDEFSKQYKYNINFTLPSGEKIRVTKIADSILPSGRKVEVFVDIAGNQYFQYRAADDTVLKEDYFRKKENMLFGQNFRFVDNKLYKTDFMGNLTLAEENKTENLKIFNTHIKYHSVYKDLVLDKIDNIDMTQFLLSTIKQKFKGDNYKIKYTKGNKFEPESVLVKDKNGNNILAVEYQEQGISYQTFNSKFHNFYFIKSNGIVTMYQYQETDGSYIRYDYEDDGKTIHEYHNIDKNGNGIIKRYKNGKPDRILTNGECSFNLIAEKLNNIIPKSHYGSLIFNASQLNELLILIDKNNVNEIMTDYQTMYNIEDFYNIVNNNSKNDKIKALSAHIKKCLIEASDYKPYKKIKNDQIKNDNYTSKYIYDVQYNGNEVTINNKTTGKKSILDFDKLLKNIKDPLEQIGHMINMQKLPAEILEFYANEGVTLRGEIELNNHNESNIKSGKNEAGGFYKNANETITLPSHTPDSIYIHEILHAVDFDKLGKAESTKQKLNKAFELGLKRYETAGYTKNYQEINKNNTKKERYYFSTNTRECWSSVGEMLFNGKCKGQELLKKFWPEFIELEKQAIAQIQSKPANERYKKTSNLVNK